MTVDSVTCPECQTRFRYQHEQLQAAEGFLRCGVCQHIFNATEQLEDSAQQGLNLSIPQPSPLTTERDQIDPPYSWDGATAHRAASTATEISDAPPLTEDGDRELLKGLSTLDHGFEFHQQGRSGRRWPWALANLFALLVLLAQAAYWQRGWILQHPQLNDELKHQLLQLCQRAEISCEPSSATITKREPSAAISRNLLVREHPDVAQALIVDAILVNPTASKTPFPALHLIFSDIHGIEVASRIFSPSEYLAGEANALSSLASQQPVHIAMEIVNPGPEAVNYQLKLLAAQ